jgi:glutathione S-transferase
VAILQYLDCETPWWPATPFEQAQVLRWMSFEQSRHMRPLAQLRLHLSLHRDRGPNDEDMVRFKCEAEHALMLLDGQLARQGPSGWVATSVLPRIVDVALYPPIRADRSPGRGPPSRLRWSRPDKDGSGPRAGYAVRDDRYIHHDRPPLVKSESV